MVKATFTLVSYAQCSFPPQNKLKHNFLDDIHASHIWPNNKYERKQLFFPIEMDKWINFGGSYSAFVYTVCRTHRM